MRLIDADAIAPKLEDKFNQDIVRYAPTIDAVPVVRCKDCIVPYCKGTRCPVLNGAVPPSDFYCAYGERKSE